MLMFIIKAQQHTLVLLLTESAAGALLWRGHQVAQLLRTNEGLVGQVPQEHKETKELFCVYLFIASFYRQNLH